MRLPRSTGPSCCAHSCANRFDPAGYEGLLKDLCSRHSHFIPAEDYVRHRLAVNRAIAEVVGEIKGPLLQSLLSWKGLTCELPSSQAILFWIRDTLPEHFRDVLSRARAYQLQESADPRLKESGNAPGETECGLHGIEALPYGVHLCHFYERRDELTAALVPYFAAGLRSRERCIWITAAPLNAAEARSELRKAGIDVDGAIARGDLVLRDFSEWYAEAERMRGSEVVDVWLAEEARALADGYSGLRITGNTSFLTAETWSGFMAYEEAVNCAFPGRRIVTLCTYRLGGSAAAEVLDVAHRHGGTLEHRGGTWQLVTAR